MYLDDEEYNTIPSGGVSDPDLGSLGSENGHFWAFLCHSMSVLSHFGASFGTSTHGLRLLRVHLLKMEAPQSYNG